MTEAEDMDAMAVIADAIVDVYMGAHDDDTLTTFMSAMKGKFKNEKGVIRLMCGLVAELINKVYDLENPG